MCTSSTKKTATKTTAYDANGKYVRRQNWQGMNWISQWRRLAIYQRDNFTCVYCGAHISEVKISLDHIIPDSIQSNDHETNLVTCCCKCNSSRADRTVVEFVDAVANYVNHGATKQSILANIATCISTPLNIENAKKLVREHGSCAKAVQSLFNN